MWRSIVLLLATRGENLHYTRRLWVVTEDRKPVDAAISFSVIMSSIPQCAAQFGTLCRAITLCFMYAAITLTFTHTNVDTQLCTLLFQTLLLLGGMNCSEHRHTLQLLKQ